MEKEEAHICSVCENPILYGDAIFLDAEGVYRGNKDISIRDKIIYHLECIISTILDEIKEGETDQREFKASFRGFDGKKDEKLEFGILKTICGFLNTNGGKLFIGIDNNGIPVGIDKDYKYLSGKKNRDGFEVYLTRKIQKTIGLGHNGLWKREFPTINNKEICIVEVRRSPKPVILKYDGKEYYFVRDGTSTNLLPISEMIIHIYENFKR